MIIAGKFVYIHMPKTGGTFVTEVLRRVHEGRPARRGFMLPRPAARLLRRVGVRPRTPSGRFQPIVDLEPKHGTCRDIPPAHCAKPIVSMIRNPFDWYVSQYEFGWWKRTFEYHPEQNPTPVGFAIEKVLPSFQRRHRNFPDLSFREFMELCSEAADHYNQSIGCSLGLYSHGFLNFYFREPRRAARLASDRGSSPERLAKEMFDVRFLETRRLNEALHEFLLAAGYDPGDINFILSLDRILPLGRGRQKGQEWERYYDDRLLDLVAREDRACLALHEAIVSQPSAKKAVSLEASCIR